MSHKVVPKYVLKALERRRKIADRLIGACAEVDTFAERFGVDTDKVSEVDNATLAAAIRKRLIRQGVFAQICKVGEMSIIGKARNEKEDGSVNL